MSAEKTSSLLAEMRMLLRPLTDPAQRRRTLEFIWTTFWPVMFARAVAVDVASFFGMGGAPMNASGRRQRCFGARSIVSASLRTTPPSVLASMRAPKRRHACSRTAKALRVWSDEGVHDRER